ncbi:Hsp20/alpha crystallin family protein [Massilia yuzhufengensis]|uniref:Heat shock protein Hsp20 n=1 Tax=Massilia yuzhufengensis TaxID=1164594 RepID=A0A1I1QGH4_9BURK|nr:Hsp20/alpha crystallin family protein [Massilia yuzhufengensis]SFD21201.1 heat shock protein Hsp20 [Massilia yuzhufengensis]
MNIIRRNNPGLAAYRPGSVEDQFGRMVENMFEDFFAPLAQGQRWEGIDAAPRLDVTETEKTFEIQAELPGVEKDDVKVSVDGQRITIEAECRKANERREGETVVYAERTARRFMRSFALPTEVDDGAAQARLENGVLQLSLPKKQGTEARRLTIQ